ncbi:peroxisomal catalase [Nadsonia fulvescens var. elongata DSM 6958]|uniref:Catalase n=1 Tax=Nadsonia fulvescens var. elongata DSM 6958 TaxID=857566 RepID=A0A1E3PMZ7_9ASCO|nr:peroxisomal catalase [Nadsonia fulvescens var. elongata DSM 6958]
MSETSNTYTASNGCPVSDPNVSQRIGRHGPLLLQDFQLIDTLSHFDRERIPERVVHAKGAGAYGEFEVTHDISDICKADFLNKVGKKTRMFARFSTVGGEKGSADMVRDPRGFSMKLYTEEGNLDLVYNNTPIFFLRDPIKFPYFIHTQKRNPQTNLKDPNAFWDYFALNQESLHQVMILFSDRGTPKSFTKMHGYSGHAYKWVNAKGEWVYVQVHVKSDQGIENFSAAESIKMAGENPDYCTKDLFDRIEAGEKPSWTWYVQVMSQEEAAQQEFSIFDLTKVWPQKKFPLRPFGKMTLTSNPQNFFAETEQVAFSPSHTVPGMEFSADPVLQSRLFSYPDTHRHRLGVNYQQIPINCPLRAHNPFQRDGAMCVTSNYGSEPNYPTKGRAGGKVPGVKVSYRSDVEAPTNSPVWHGREENFHWEVDAPSSVDFEQPRQLWKVFKKTGQDDALINNVVGHLSNADESVQEAVLQMFANADKEISLRLQVALKEYSK